MRQAHSSQERGQTEEGQSRRKLQEKSVIAVGRQKNAREAECLRAFFMSGSRSGRHQLGFNQFRLLVGVVRGTYQRAGSDVLEAHLVTFLGKPGEHVRVHETLDR
jgi:hypothetical protein